MWTRVAHNCYALDMDACRGVPSDGTLELPVPDTDVNDETHGFHVRENGVVRRATTTTARTFHGCHGACRAVVTLYEEHLRAFVITPTYRYTVARRMGEEVYDVRRHALCASCPCSVTRAAHESSHHREAQALASQSSSGGGVGTVPGLYEFTQGSSYTKLNIIFGLTSAFKGAYSNDEDALVERLVAVVNLLNYVYQNALCVQFELDEADQRTVIQGGTFAAADLTAYTGEFDALIGEESYDVGHVLDMPSPPDTSNGVAMLHSAGIAEVKGRGYTGAIDTDDDQVLVVDILCHEIGHQFGAYHVQSDCHNMTPGSDVEPYSGSTIMGYAGICDTDVQPQADPYFNALSVHQMRSHVDVIVAAGVGTTFTTGVPIPTIQTSWSRCAIPQDCDFELRVPTSDITGTTVGVDTIYAWESVGVGPTRAIHRSRRRYGTVNRLFPRDDGGSDVGDNTRLTALPTVDNITSIRLINGYNASAGATWHGSVEIGGQTYAFNATQSTHAGAAEVATVTLAASGVAPTELLVTAWTLSFSTSDSDTWASDLVVELRTDSGVLWAWGGFDYTIADDAQNAEGWPRSFRSSASQVGVGANVTANVVDYGYRLMVQVPQENSYNATAAPEEWSATGTHTFSALSSKLLYSVYVLDVTEDYGTLALTQQAFDGATQTLQLAWTRGGTDVVQEILADEVRVHVATGVDAQGEPTFDYEDAATCVYQGPNDGSADIPVTDIPQSFHGTTRFFQVNFEETSTDTERLYVLRTAEALDIPVAEIPCLLRGTRVRLASGEEVAIETLREGDALQNADGGEPARVVRVLRTSQTGARSLCVLRRDALEPGVPTEDLYCSDLHLVRWRGAVYLPRQWPYLFEPCPPTDVEYFHVQTADYARDWLVAQGVAVESYADDEDSAAWQQRWAQVATGVRQALDMMRLDVRDASWVVVGPGMMSVR